MYIIPIAFPDAPWWIYFVHGPEFEFNPLKPFPPPHVTR